MKRSLVRGSASAIRVALQKEVMTVLTTNLKDLFRGGEIMIWMGSGREYCCLRSLTWVNTMLVKNVRWSQQGDHVEEGILVDMDQCWGREGSRQEVESRGRGAGVETLDSLEG